MQFDEEFFRVIACLEGASVSYAVAGGVALAWHGTPRFTRDIDLVVPSDQLTAITQLLEPLGYHASAPPSAFTSGHFKLARFIKTSPDGDHLLLDLLLTDSPRALRVLQDHIATDGPDHAVRIVSRDDLIWMKTLRNSPQDQVDITHLQQAASNDQN